MIPLGYFLFCATLLILLASLDRRSRPGMGREIDRTDPLLIAYLRGGTAELLPVLLASMVERGTLVASEGRLAEGRLERRKRANLPEEDWVLEKLKAEGLENAISDPRLKGIGDRYQTELESAGLLTSARLRALSRRRVWMAVVLIVLGAAAGIQLALMRQEADPEVLVIPAIFFAFLASRFGLPRRTRAGDRLLAELKQEYGWGEQPVLIPDWHTQRRGELTLRIAVLGPAGWPSDLAGTMNRLLSGAASAEDSAVTEVSPG